MGEAQLTLFFCNRASRLWRSRSSISRSFLSLLNLSLSAMILPNRCSNRSSGSVAWIWVGSQVAPFEAALSSEASLPVLSIWKLLA